MPQLSPTMGILFFIFIFSLMFILMLNIMSGSKKVKIF